MLPYWTLSPSNNINSNNTTDNSFDSDCPSTISSKSAIISPRKSRFGNTEIHDSTFNMFMPVYNFKFLLVPRGTKILHICMHYHVYRSLYVCIYSSSCVCKCTPEDYKFTTTLLEYSLARKVQLTGRFKEYSINHMVYTVTVLFGS